MIEKGLVYFLKTGVKIPYFVLLDGRLTLKNVTAVAEGVWKTALLKRNSQKVDTRVLNDPMHDLSASESRLCV